MTNSVVMLTVKIFASMFMGKILYMYVANFNNNVLLLTCSVMIHLSKFT